jgi:hypothetical protein
MLNACATVPAVTTNAQCTNAQASVNQMNSTFTSLSSPAAYASQVAAITQNLSDEMPSLSTYLGVGIGLCATVFQIGIQADLLTNQMLSDNGMATIAGPTCLDATAIPLPSVGGLLAGSGAIVLALGALFIFMSLKK